MSKRSDKRQARTEAKLRYGTTQDELTSILKGLKGDYKAGVKQARVGAKMVAGGAKQALPAAKALYGAGIKGNTAAQQLVAKELQGLPADSPFRAAVSVGQGGAQSRLSEAMAMTGKELVGRRVDALAGGVREVQSLRSQYGQDREKTLDQLVSNAKQAGLYTSTRYGELRQQSKDFRLKKSDQKETKRHNKASEKNTAATNQSSGDDKYLTKFGMTRQDFLGLSPSERKRLTAKADGKGKKPKMATPEQQGKMQDNINSALHSAKKLKGAGLTRSQAAQVLLAGDEKSGISKAGPLAASVGLDLAFDTHISKRNVGELRKRRIQVKKLGLPFNDPKHPTYGKGKQVNLVAGIKVPTA